MTQPARGRPVGTQHPHINRYRGVLVLILLIVILGMIWLDGRYGTLAAVPPMPVGAPTATPDSGTRWYFQRSQWLPQDIPPQN